MKRNWIVKISVICSAVIFCTTLRAQTAVEEPLDSDLSFRGQGRANLCFAFAEEQLLKDYLCAKDCENNSSRWQISVLDIARAHQQRWTKTISTPLKNLSLDMLSTGSAFFMPFHELNISSVRDSACTLERDIFFLNRSKISNPKREDLPTFLTSIFQAVKYGADPELPFSRADLLATWKTLKALARSAISTEDYLAKVIDFKKCEGRVVIPRFQLRSDNPSEPSKIIEVITKQLQLKRSLYASVCAEVLENEKLDDQPCGRHAVVLKAMRSTKCDKGRCDSEIQVVDSAFFSRRPRATDGSTWIPLSVVVNSIAKSAADFQRVLMTASQISMNAEMLETTARESAQGAIALADQALANFKGNQFNEMAQMMLNQMWKSLAQDITYVQSSRKLMAITKQIKFSSTADIRTLEPILTAEFKLALQRRIMSLNSTRIEGNGLAWLE